MASVSYRDAGLDLDVYERTLAGMMPLLRRTHPPRVLDGFGGFASLFSLDFNSRLFARNYRHPVLVSCTDGVGSKLKVASLTGKHDTVSIDLVGGETAILPDFYAPGDYDMAGFCVGVVERDRIINGRTIRPGDLVVGVASSGLHSNGYSLVRKAVFDHAGLTV